MSPSEILIDLARIANAAGGDVRDCSMERQPHDDVQPWLLKRDRLTAYSLPQIQKWPPEQWLIHGVLPKGELVLLYGPSRVGKSFVLIDMLMCVEGGRPFAGIDVDGVPVLYIVTEWASGLPKRFAAWESKIGAAAPI